MHKNSSVSRALGPKVSPAALCFCFLFREPGPSEAASEGALTERSIWDGPKATPLKAKVASTAADANVVKQKANLEFQAHEHEHLMNRAISEKKKSLSSRALPRTAPDER